MNRSLQFIAVCALVALAAIASAVAIVHAELGLAQTRASATDSSAEPASRHSVAAASATS